MAKTSKISGDAQETDMGLIKKLLILELFKLGVPQTEIGKKVKMKAATVNTFLKGAKKPK